MKHLRITDTITLVRQIPVDEAHYPGMNSDEAMESEATRDEEERWESVLDYVSDSSEGLTHVTSVDIIDEGDNDKQRSADGTSDPYYFEGESVLDDGDKLGVEYDENVELDKSGNLVEKA